MLNIDFIDDGYKIKSIGCRDLLEVTQWFIKEYEPFDFEELKQRFIEYYSSNGEVFIEIIREETLRAILKGRVENQYSKEFFIGFYIVQEEYRHKGIGTEILKCILKYMKSLGIEKVTVMVEGDNEKSLRFWEKQGFTIVRTVKDYFEKEYGDEDMIIMQKYMHNIEGT